MNVEDIKLGTKIQHVFGVATIVAFKEEEKHHTVLIRFDGETPQNAFLHNGINQKGGNLSYSYIELEKMNKNCFWIDATNYPMVNDIEDIEDD